MNAERLSRFLPICAAVLVAASFSLGWRAIQPAPVFGTTRVVAQDRFVRARLTHHPRSVAQPASRGKTAEAAAPIHGRYVVGVEPAS